MIIPLEDKHTPLIIENIENICDIDLFKAWLSQGLIIQWNQKILF